MPLRFELLYLIGFTPWDRADTPVPEPLRALVEGPAARPLGRALDLGCGMGRHSIYLAEHGWLVTGVDAVERALRVARRRAAARGVAVTFLRGDVTRLAETRIAGPFDLLLDRGCFHGLSDEARLQYGEGVTRLAAPGAELLLFAFGHAGSLLGPRGAERAEIERSLSPGWAIEWSAREEHLPHPAPGGATATWYRLRRKAA